VKTAGSTTDAHVPSITQAARFTWTAKAAPTVQRQRETSGTNTQAVAGYEFCRKRFATAIAPGMAVVQSSPTAWRERSAVGTMTACNKKECDPHHSNMRRTIDLDYSLTTNWVCKLAVESSPAHTSKVPGSTAQALVCGLQKSNSSLPSENLSVCVSPGFNAIRRKPLS